jgi:hypothetical protein
MGKVKGFRDQGAPKSILDCQKFGANRKELKRVIQINTHTACSVP